MSARRRTGVAGREDIVGAAGPGEGNCLGLGDVTCRLPLPMAAQRGLFRAVAIVVDRGAIRRTLGLPADGLHDGLPKW